MGLCVALWALVNIHAVEQSEELRSAPQARPSENQGGCYASVVTGLVDARRIP